MRSLRTLGEVGETPEETYLHSGALREGRVCLGGVLRERMETV